MQFAGRRVSKGKTPVLRPWPRRFLSGNEGAGLSATTRVRTVDWVSRPDGVGFKVAEGEGFEPPEPFGSPDFKAGAIDHSATLPKKRVNHERLCTFTAMEKFAFAARRSGWLQAEFLDSFTQGGTGHTQQFGGAGEVAIEGLKRAHDHLPLQSFQQRLVEFTELDVQ